MDLRSEMNANVWKIVANVGDTVEDGDPVVILESMKMEIPVLAEGAGTVRQVNVTEGGTVEEGQVIAVIE